MTVAESVLKGRYLACSISLHIAVDRIKYNYNANLKSMMPPYAFRLQRPAQSCFNMILSSSPPRDKGKICFRSMAGSTTELDSENYKGNIKERLLHEPMCDSGFLIGPRSPQNPPMTFKYNEELTSMFDDLEIPVPQGTATVEAVLDSIVNNFRPKLSDLLGENAELAVRLKEAQLQMLSQQETILSLKEQNRGLLMDRNTLRLKLEGIAKEFGTECQLAATLEEQLDQKTREVHLLKDEALQLRRHAKELVAKQRSSSSQLANQIRRSQELQKQCQSLMKEWQLRQKEMHSMSEEERRSSAETEVKRMVESEHLRVVTGKYERIKEAYSKLMRESEKRERELHLHIQYLQEELQASEISLKAIPLSPPAFSSKATIQLQQNNLSLQQQNIRMESQITELREQLSEITDRFLKLREFQSIESFKIEQSNNDG